MLNCHSDTIIGSPALSRRSVQVYCESSMLHVVIVYAESRRMLQCHHTRNLESGEPRYVAMTRVCCPSQDVQFAGLQASRPETTALGRCGAPHWTELACNYYDAASRVACLINSSSHDVATSANHRLITECKCRKQQLSNQELPRDMHRKRECLAILLKA